MTGPLTIRSLRSDADYLQCVDLQRATWGEDYEELVPPTVLKVTQKIGGVAAGAFDPEDVMLGFVFGMAGVRSGNLIHWSDMLAVRESARDRGVGQRLKEFQRAAARAVGARTMYWTYDPLVARNAHMNFNRLGVKVDEYVENMYGDSSSDLHRGLGTDRFIVAWPLDGASGLGTIAYPAGASGDARNAPVLNADSRVPSAEDLAATGTPATLRVEIPLDIVRLRDAAPALAARWRASTRAAFQWALGSGYGVARFVTDPASDRGWYVMTRVGADAG